jgi:hypothetical protein
MVKSSRSPGHGLKKPLPAGLLTGRNFALFQERPGVQDCGCTILYPTNLNLFKSSGRPVRLNRIGLQMGSGSLSRFSAGDLSESVSALPQVGKWWNSQRAKTQAGLRIPERWYLPKEPVKVIEYSLCLTFQPNASRIFPRVPEVYHSPVGPDKRLS